MLCHLIESVKLWIWSHFYSSLHKSKEKHRDQKKFKSKHPKLFFLDCVEIEDLNTHQIIPNKKSKNVIFINERRLGKIEMNRYQLWGIKRLFFEGSTTLTTAVPSQILSDSVCVKTLFLCGHRWTSHVPSYICQQQFFGLQKQPHSLFKLQNWHKEKIPISITKFY